jgi:hypothetical protein
MMVSNYLDLCLVLCQVILWLDLAWLSQCWVLAKECRLRVFSFYDWKKC